ncbi:hypothetical protein Tco_0327155 [Tanacetum coccineum]
MKRGFLGEHILLFDSMLIHDQPGQGEGPTLTVESQHTPIASPTTSQPTTSQPMSSQEQPSQVPTTEPIITTSSPPLYETTIPHTTSSMPHDSPLSGGDTPGSDEGSKKLNELTELCTKLSDKVTSLEEDLKQTKKVYGKALTKLVKKVKHLEAKLKSTSVRRKARMLDEREETDNIDWSIVAEQVQERQSDTIKRYQTLKKEPVSVAQVRKNMLIYLKNMAGYKISYFKGKSYERVAKETLLQESFKKLRSAKASRLESIQEQPTEEPKDLSEEELKKMLEIVLVEEIKAEALQVKYPIINWEIHTEGSHRQNT